MKKILRLFSMVLSLVILLSFSVSADYPTDLEYLADRPSFGYGAMILYKDSAHTEQIIHMEDLPVGEKVYYTLYCNEGDRIFGLNMSEEYAEYLDNECFILSEKPELFVRTIYIDSCVMGDFKKDGSLDSVDVAWLIRHCAGFEYDEERCEMRNGDYTCDGVVNFKDIYTILRHFAGWDTEYNHGGVQTEFETEIISAEELEDLQNPYADLDPDRPMPPPES